MGRCLPTTSFLLKSNQGERGSSTIQMVILLPLLFLAVFSGMQASLMYQGRSIALAAAQEGARAAASEQGTVPEGISSARNFIDATSADLTMTTISGSRSPTSATITVTTHTLSVIPGWSPRITQSASMPVERIT